MPKDSESAVERAFQQCAKKHQFTLDEQPKKTDLTEVRSSELMELPEVHLHSPLFSVTNLCTLQLFEDTTPYFVAELPSGRLLVHGISSDRFPLQFGRSVSRAQFLSQILYPPPHSPFAFVDPDIARTLSAEKRCVSCFRRLIS